MKPATLIAMVLFSLFALGHLLRLLFGVAFIVGGVPVPLWASAVAAIFFAGLAGMLWREARK